MALVTIVGAGFMGTATAWPLTDNGHTVRLVGTHLDGEIIRSCKEKGFHPRLQRELPAGVRPYFVEEIPAALDGAEIVVSGVMQRREIRVNNQGKNTSLQHRRERLSGHS